MTVATATGRARRRAHEPRHVGPHAPRRGFARTGVGRHPTGRIVAPTAQCRARPGRAAGPPTSPVPRPNAVPSPPARRRPAGAGPVRPARPWRRGAGAPPARPVARPARPLVAAARATAGRHGAAWRPTGTAGGASARPLVAAARAPHRHGRVARPARPLDAARGARRHGRVPSVRPLTPRPGWPRGDRGAGRRDRPARTPGGPPCRPAPRPVRGSTAGGWRSSTTSRARAYGWASAWFVRALVATVFVSPITDRARLRASPPGWPAARSCGPGDRWPGRPTWPRARRRPGAGGARRHRCRRRRTGRRGRRSPSAPRAPPTARACRARGRLAAAGHPVPGARAPRSVAASMVLVRARLGRRRRRAARRGQRLRDGRLHRRLGGVQPDGGPARRHHHGDARRRCRWRCVLVEPFDDGRRGAARVRGRWRARSVRSWPRPRCPGARRPAPALRRIDTLLVLGPLWAAAAGAF